MTSFAVYDTLGFGIDMSPLPESEQFIPVDVSVQSGPLTYNGSIASGAITGTSLFNAVEISYKPIQGSSDLEINTVSFGTRTGQTFTVKYIIDSLSLIATRVALDAGDFEWLVISLAGDDSVAGNSFADHLKGGDGSDVINGHGGNDIILGGIGNDRMVGDTGDDEIDGGEGEDTAFFWGRPSEYSFYVRLDGAVEVTDNSGVMGTDVVLNVEKFEFQLGGEFTQADLFNPVKVYAGNDTITGTNGNNILRGYGGTDTIKALSGNDYLYGGIGNDKLYGGSGKDQFVFDTRPTSTNRDTIYDFNVKDDTLRLDNAVFTKIGANGYLKAGAFWANNTGKAHDKDDRIIYDKDSGILYYDADGTGSGKAAVFTTISKHLSMSSKDVYIV